MLFDLPHDIPVLLTNWSAVNMNVKYTDLYKTPSFASVSLASFGQLPRNFSTRSDCMPVLKDSADFFKGCDD